MNRHLFRALAGISVAGTLATGAGLVHAQQSQYVQARVISATPIRETTGSDVSYNVTYEYNGRQYTTQRGVRYSPSHWLLYHSAIGLSGRERQYSAG